MSRTTREQDLVISRALVGIFSHPQLHDALAFRGGTALYKLHLPSARYSEDTDLVQTNAGAAGPMMEALRGALDPWLGKPRYKQTEGRITFVYRFDFLADISPRLAPGYRWEPDAEATEVSSRFDCAPSRRPLERRWRVSGQRSA